MKETPIEEMDGEKMFLTECYALAGMVTYIEATGGNVLAASIVARGLPVLEVKPEIPFICMEQWRLPALYQPDRFAQASRLSEIQAAQVIVAHIGLEAARICAVNLAPVGCDLAETLSENDQTRTVYSYASAFAESRLGVDSGGRFWSIFDRMVWNQSQKIVQANWLQVERYRYQLETSETITEFAGGDVSSGGRIQYPSVMTEQEVREMWKEAEEMAKPRR